MNRIFFKRKGNLFDSIDDCFVTLCFYIIFKKLKKKEGSNLQKTNKKDVQYLNEFQRDYKDVLELFQKLKYDLSYQKKFGDILSELIQEKVNISKELSEYFRYIKYRTDGMNQADKYKMYYLFGMILVVTRSVDSYDNFDLDDTYKKMCKAIEDCCIDKNVGMPVYQLMGPEEDYEDEDGYDYYDEYYKEIVLRELKEFILETALILKRIEKESDEFYINFIDLLDYKILFNFETEEFELLEDKKKIVVDPENKGIENSKFCIFNVSDFFYNVGRKYNGTFGFTRFYHVNKDNNVNITDDQAICIGKFFHLLLLSATSTGSDEFSVVVSEFLNDSYLESQFKVEMDFLLEAIFSEDRNVITSLVREAQIPNYKTLDIK